MNTIKLWIARGLLAMASGLTAVAAFATYNRCSGEYLPFK